MKPFNLEEYLKNPSRKVVTRGGYPVRIVCTDAHDNNCPIIALVSREDGTEDVFMYTKQGTFFDSEPDIFDLFFTPEKHERWVNLYKSESGEYSLGASICISKEHAEVMAGRECIATCKIEWEE